MATLAYYYWVSNLIETCKMQHIPGDHGQRILAEQEMMNYDLELKKRQLDWRTRELSKREVLTEREREKLDEEKQQGIINWVYQVPQMFDTSAGRTAENANFLQPASPTLHSPGRYLMLQKNGKYDPNNVHVERLMPVTKSNNHGNLWQQIRVRGGRIRSHKKTPLLFYS